MIVPIALAGASLINTYLDQRQQGKQIDAMKKQRMAQQAANKKYAAGLSREAQQGGIDVMGRMAGLRGDVMGQARESSLNVRGDMMRRGMEGSIAGVSAVNKPFQQGTKVLAGERMKLEMANEETKRQARQQLNQFNPQSSTADAQAKAEIEQAKATKSANLWKGIAGAGMQTVQGLWGEQGMLNKDYQASLDAAQSKEMGDRLYTGMKREKELAGMDLQAEGQRLSNQLKQLGITGEQQAQETAKIAAEVMAEMKPDTSDPDAMKAVQYEIMSRITKKFSGEE